MQLPAISGATKLTGLIGYPVAHSLSPRLQHYWLALHKINARYLAFEVAPTHVREAILGAQALGLKGINVTVPHKEQARQIVHSCDEDAQKIGAVNCITFAADGSIRGSNTDAYGFIENLKQNVPDLARYLPHVVVLGAGGAVRAMIVALQHAGASRVTLINRTLASAELLAKEFGGDITCATWPDIANVLPHATLLVNATSLGMYGHAPLDIDLSALPVTALVHDIVYNPLETGLLKAAKARGNPTVAGLGMLMYQAQKSFSLWHGVTPEVTPELATFLLQKL